MTSACALTRLSDRVGIEPFYWDVYGERHETSDDTRRAFLAAMGHLADDDEAAAASLRIIENRPWQRVIEPVTIVRLTESPQISVFVTVPISPSDLDLNWDLDLENGQHIQGCTPICTLPVVEHKGTNKRVTLTLPNTIPLGYHRLRLHLGPTLGEGALIIAPASSHRPDWLDQQGNRAWGVACQLYGLRTASNWGLGDFSDLASLCEKAALQGGGAVGLPPLHAMFPTQPERLSPYSPSSRLFLNPNYIDVTAVADFSTCAEAQALVETPGFCARLEKVRTTDAVLFDEVADLKRIVFQALFTHFEKTHPPGSTTPRREDFATFVAKGGDLLTHFAVFETLQEHFSPLSVHDWPRPYKDPKSDETKAFAHDHQTRVHFHIYLQWLADQQLAAAQAVCVKAGMDIGLYRDLAVGVSPDGADAWMDSSVFVEGVRFGAPPDPLGPTGQDWGMPPFNPDTLYEQAYRPYIDMLQANMRHAGAVRIDHVMWLQQMFWIPPGGDGRTGAYVRYPLDDLLAVLALESHRNQCLVIGEALGTVLDGFCDRLARENILSYCLLQFERHTDGLYKRPDAYPALALTTPASHDLPTLAGFWRETDIGIQQDIGLIASDEASEKRRSDRHQDRAQLIAALADQDLLPTDFTNTPDISDTDMATLIAAIHRFLARSPAALLMVNLEDILASTAQINVPGTIDEYPNWRLKLPFDLDSISRMSDFTDICRERSTLKP